MTNKDTEANLDEAIGDIFARACMNNEYFGNDGWYELHTPTLKQEIKALISQLENEARLDEAAYAQHATAHMSRKDAHQFITDRIATLKENK